MFMCIKSSHLNIYDSNCQLMLNKSLKGINILTYSGTIKIKVDFTNIFEHSVLARSNSKDFMCTSLASHTITYHVTAPTSSPSLSLQSTSLAFFVCFFFFLTVAELFLMPRVPSPRVIPGILTNSNLIFS